MEHEHTHEHHEHHEHTASAHTKFKLTTPIAIIIAGVIIGACILFSSGIHYSAPTKEFKDHTFGNPNANIQLIEYSDLECPYCKVFHVNMRTLMNEEHENVLWIYRHFPLPFHPKATPEAIASECAATVGSEELFWNYINRIFELTPSNNQLDPSVLSQIATELGIHATKFKKCTDEQATAPHVEHNVSQGKMEGITGTPTTMVLIKKNGVFVPFTTIPGAQEYKVLKEIVEAAKKETAKQ
jgi:protein-disulfide isomerase